MKVLIAAVLLTLSVLSTLGSAQAASGNSASYGGYPEWARNAFEPQG